MEPRALVITPDPVELQLLEETLRRLGLRVEGASSGGDGLWLARHTAYAVAVVERRLPEGDGLGLCRELGGEECGWVPVVVLSAEAVAEPEAEARRAGAAAYLVKPCAPAVVAAAVAAAVALPSSMNKDGNHD